MKAHELFTRLFCRHDYVFVRNLYGDQINVFGGARSIWQCSKCNKEQWRDYLCMGRD